MTLQFFEKPILNTPYGYPGRYWELDTTGQPTQQIIEARRPAVWNCLKNGSRRSSTTTPFLN